MIVLLSESPIAVSPNTTSGSFDFSIQDLNGMSMYTLYYKYPSTVSIGTNLTIEILVVVNQLTGLRAYLRDYGATVTLNIDANHVPTKTLHVYPGVEYLHQGGHWGPVNVSLPLDEVGTGIRIGQEAKANLTITFADNVWLDAPILNYTPESGRRVVGTVTIQDQSPSGDLRQYLPYIAVAIGLVLVLISVVLGKKRAN
jgi:hypothetical protein